MIISRTISKEKLYSRKIRRKKAIYNYDYSSERKYYTIKDITKILNQ